ncbi:hypothetical protein [Desulforamulus putei]|uniref:Uncharacterized protein n=1 Tax=Desulforamulus putei DSM 12395 TaxID=1121429 RepID=A0A1M4U425_9FIRM|nr:hypothetical protein [Desulforamulus putei]SHE51393.1 hypothetical protein SAMN02745133_00571 [Desulforamulus putei DSM 12395]
MKFKLITKISLGITGIVLVFSTALGYTFVKGTNPGSHISMTRVKELKSKAREQNSHALWFFGYC